MPDSSERYFYFDASRNRLGPLSEADIFRLIAEGAISSDTLVWYAELPDWTAAGQVDRLAAGFSRSAPPPPPPQWGALPPSSPNVAPRVEPPARAYSPNPAVYAPQAGIADTTPHRAVGLLRSDMTVWGLFWRSILALLGASLVVPAPWVQATLYRYIATRTILPNGKHFTFAGTPGDIWYIFVGLAVVGLVGQFIAGAVLITLPVSFALSVLVFRWLCAKIGADDGSVRLTFTGGIWSYVGWSVLLMLSFITIIGWAWIARILLSWLCQNVRGTHSFTFEGSGGGILWRVLVLSLASVFVIPIPWMMRWFAVWLISQIQVRPSRA